MKVVESAAAFRRHAAGMPRPMVLVPTMGALHAGHLALLHRAQNLAGPHGSVVASIFVNPIQFDCADDLAAYPRPLADDLAACRNAGVALVFAPHPAALYAPDHSVVVHESCLTRQLCGAARPGHFDGVCTVVLKLFHLCRPDIAVFGGKDFQQLAVIRRMVRDLDVEVEIVAHPTVRDPDGLALSSRNARLEPAHRADAPRIHRALRAAQRMFHAGERRAETLLAAARDHLATSPFLEIEFLELVDARSLEPVAEAAAPALVATAVRYGPVRLIDHLMLDRD